MILTYSHQSFDGLEKTYRFINTDSNYPGKEIETFIMSSHLKYTVSEVLSSTVN